MQPHVPEPMSRLLAALWRRRKYASEIAFWRREISAYQRWYRGKIAELHQTGSPVESEKVKYATLEHSAILTWLELHQRPKYLYDLQLPRTAFSGQRILDVGAGPMPSATCFEGAEVWCLDPLYPQYLLAGFPLHYYDRVRFVNAFAENIPVEDGFFDAAISVNSLDHVDDLEQTAGEIRRVLKPRGRLAMHLHYHPPRRAEPIMITDELVRTHFGWCDGLTKVSESQSKYGLQIPAGEKYVLWKSV